MLAIVNRVSSCLLAFHWSLQSEHCKAKRLALWLKAAASRRGPRVCSGQGAPKGIIGAGVEKGRKVITETKSGRLYSWLQLQHRNSLAGAKWQCRAWQDTSLHAAELMLRDSAIDEEALFCTIQRHLHAEQDTMSFNRCLLYIQHMLYTKHTLCTYTLL